MSPTPDAYAGGNSVTSYYTLATTFGQTVGRSVNRRALILNPSTVGDIVYSWDPSPPGVTGLYVPRGSAAVVLCRTLHGALLNGPLFAASPAGAAVVAVIEEIGP